MDAMRIFVRHAGWLESSSRCYTEKAWSKDGRSRSSFKASQWIGKETQGWEQGRVSARSCRRVRYRRDCCDCRCCDRRAR